MIKPENLWKILQIPPKNSENSPKNPKNFPAREAGGGPRLRRQGRFFQILDDRGILNWSPLFISDHNLNLYALN